MTQNLSIALFDTSPTWEDFHFEPLYGKFHVIRVCVSRNIHEIEAQIRLLKNEEIDKHARIFKQSDKNIFLTSQVMKRVLCGLYLKISPAETNFLFTEHKKPYVSGFPNFHFNISHSGDWVVFLFSSSPCGIDIEKIKPDFDFEGMMPSVFHPREIDWINGQPDRNRAFFKLWTMKESLLKAQGTGLIDDLNQWDLTSTQTMPDPDWHVQTFSVGEDYYLSTCVKEHPKEFKYFEFAGSIDFPS